MHSFLSIRKNGCCKRAIASSANKDRDLRGENSSCVSLVCEFVSKVKHWCKADENSEFCALVYKGLSPQNDV